MVIRLALCLLLTSCNTYIHPTQYQDTVSITWIRTDDPNKVCRELGAEADRNILGCANPKGKTCDIYAPQIQYTDDDHTMTLGHELAHCFLGSYHE